MGIESGINVTLLVPYRRSKAYFHSERCMPFVLLVTSRPWKYINSPTFFI